MTTTSTDPVKIYLQAPTPSNERWIISAHGDGYGIAASFENTYRSDTATELDPEAGTFFAYAYSPEEAAVIVTKLAAVLAAAGYRTEIAY